MEELGLTLTFLGRIDLLLEPIPDVDINFDRVFDIACNDAAAVRHSAGIPFYHCVSYMAVSMEALLGSKYLHMIEEAGLAGEVNRLMGRREASYLDSRIGCLSAQSQLWVDRHFSLDYTLKSLEKCTPPETRRKLRHARVLLKSESYDFIVCGFREASIASTAKITSLDSATLNERFEELCAKISPIISVLSKSLDFDKAKVLSAAHSEWMGRREWRLINGMCIVN
jgi:hypothetical protein